MKRLMAVAATCAFLLVPHAARAAWAPSGNPLCLASGDQEGLSAIPWRDGVLVGWSDLRSGDPDVYVQHVSTTGDLMNGWASDGVPVARAAGEQRYFSIAADSDDGAYVAWTDLNEHPPGLYLQRLTPAGTTASGWPVGGLRIVDSQNSRARPALAAAGDDAYLAWTVGDGVHLGRFTPEGTMAAGWPAEGVAFGPGIADHLYLALMQDGAGGVYVARVHLVRTEPPRLVLHRFARNGETYPGWDPMGIVVSSPHDAPAFPQLLPDGSAGVFVAWERLIICIDGRLATAGDLFCPMPLMANRVSSAGVLDPLWAEGVRVGSEGAVAPDGAGGLLNAFFWYSSKLDLPVPTQMDGATVIMTRVGPGARPVPSWEAVPASPEGYQQVSPSVVADGEGGAYLAWIDHRTGTAELMLTHFDASGKLASGWPFLGSLAAPAARSPQEPLLVAPRTGRPILIWTDRRAGSLDVYAEEAVAGPPAGPKLIGVGYPAPGALAVEDVRPQPVRGRFWVRLSLPDPTPTTLELIDVAGRVIESRRLDAGRPARGSIAFNESARLTPGVYWLRAVQSGRSAAARVVVAR